MYRINEIFYSLQGEGFHTGTACVFIRFSGCNLRCEFCDTQHADGTTMSLPQIVQTVNQYPQAPLIVLTGGEPSLWIDDDFVLSLKTLTGKCIAIETNGTRPLPQGIDWITLSPKEAFKGGDIYPCVLTSCDELKVVYLRQDLCQYDHIMATHRFLQPCFSDTPSEREENQNATVAAVLSNPVWRLSLQTHRILKIK